MKILNSLGLTALAAMALMALAAGNASATTLEIGGVKQNSSVTFTASLIAGGSVVVASTSGALGNTCTESHFHGSTASPFTGTQIGGPLSTLTFGKCTPRAVVVHKAGSITFENISGTTNATVRSVGAEITVSTDIVVATCTTGAGVDIGVLTGVKEGHALLHVNAVLNCGPLLPSAKWEGTYVVTSPTGLGVTA